jgi:hypothetical protein
MRNMGKLALGFGLKKILNGKKVGVRIGTIILVD